MPFGCRSPNGNLKSIKNDYLQFYISMNKAKLLFTVIPKYLVVVVVILKGLNLVRGRSGPNWNWTGSSTVPFSGSSSHIGAKHESSEPSPHHFRPPYHSHQPTTRETSRPSIQRMYVHNNCFFCCVCVTKANFMNPEVSSLGFSV